MRSKTIDGVSVLLWSDGLITKAFGYFRGIGAARESWAIEADIRAGKAFLGEVGLLSASEIPTAYKAIRRLFRAPYHGKTGFLGGEDGSFYRQAISSATGRDIDDYNSASAGASEAPSEE